MESDRPMTYAPREPARSERLPGTQRRQAAGTAPAPSPAAQVLRLQSRAGNRAVSALLPNDGSRRLTAGVRLRMESLFGDDFRDVRVHAHAGAAVRASALHARAFTYGRDIVFGQGEYQPSTRRGNALLAHELAHVVQQREATRQRSATPPPALGGQATEREAARAADAASAGLPMRVRSRAPVQLACAPLDVGEIKRDIHQGAGTPPELYSWLQVMGERSGEIGFGAAPPSGNRPDAVPQTDLSLPIEAHFFPSYLRHHDERALVVGGIHGTERPGFEVADALVDELNSGSGLARELHFHTLVVPHLNPGGIADDSRCNRQQVDLNRNFRFPGTPNPTSGVCRNTAQAPIQPEAQALMNVLSVFQPQRIVSLHAISSPAQAGIFADPATDPAARQLACSMARLVVDPSNRRGNRVTATQCNPVYGGGATGPASLGSYAPTRSITGQTVPVITLEVPEYRSLGTGTGTRSEEAFLRPLRGFLIDPADLEARADRDIVRDIEALTLPQRRLFLTGRVPPTDDLIRRIRDRVDQRVADLNAARPSALPAIRVVSHHRGFTASAGASGTTARGQAHIIFEKFTLTGSHRSGWDTLPAQYFRNGNRAAGVDRDAWLNESSATRLHIILRFSAIPGASRHHWGTDVDFNSTTVTDWNPAQGTATAGRLHALALWLQQNAGHAGFIQAYTPGRAGGHHEEPWHYSYAPIALRLREIYRADVRMTEDVIDPVLDFFNRQAVAQGLTLPADLVTALRALDVARYVHTVGPGL